MIAIDETGQALQHDYRLLFGEQDLSTRALRLTFDRAVSGLQLTRNDRLRLPSTDRPTAEALTTARRLVLCDVNRQLGWIDDTGRRLLTGPHLDDSIGVPVRTSNAEAIAGSTEALGLAPLEAPAGTEFIDLAMHGRLIVLAWSNATDQHGLSVVELGSKRHYRLSLDSRPRRVWLDREQRIWVLSADDRLLLCEGAPLPQPWLPDQTRFKPVLANPDALSVREAFDLPDDVGGSAAVLAIAGDGDALYLLTESAIHRLPFASPRDSAHRYALPQDLPATTDLRVLDAQGIALWVPIELEQLRAEQDCPVVELDDETATARLIGERYPRRTPTHQGFVANPESGAWYLSTRGVLRLSGLPLVAYHDNGTGILGRRLDSGIAATLWDRIVLEACLPPGSGLQLQVRAFDHPSQRTDRAWHDQGRPAAMPAAVRPWSPTHGDAAFWDLVIRKEAAAGEVRELRGRYLELKVRMTGNGMVTPCLHALQVWLPRRSWQRQWLPEFMQQDRDPVEGSDALANGADVRERMFAALQGIIAPLERRIDTAETLIDPLTAPCALLPGLERMLGESPPSHWPEIRRRHWLSMVGELQQWRGTYKGLCLALDIATDCAVSRGQIVPVEDFRLRRPLFTVLGVDFAAGHHPLTLDTVRSGNSIVGDTLQLGPDDARTLLLSLLPDVDSTLSTRDLLFRYADSYAHRISIVVHASATHMRGVIDEVLHDQLPAHLSSRIIETNHNFVPGLAPLLGVHTFLEQFPAWQRMVLDRDEIGGASVLSNLPVLTPGRQAGPTLYGES